MKKDKKDSDSEDYDKIMAEGTIIVIKDEKRKNKNYDDDDDPDYDQLMAEGTIIVIKDEDMKKKYIDSLKKEK